MDGGTRKPDRLLAIKEVRHTVSACWAASMLRRPMAVMLCVPGVAETGIVIDPVGVPVAEVTTKSVSVVSRYTSTASLLANPLPLMVMV